MSFLSIVLNLKAKFIIIDSNTNYGLYKCKNEMYLIMTHVLRVLNGRFEKRLFIYYVSRQNKETKIYCIRNKVIDLIILFSTLSAIFEIVNIYSIEKVKKVQKQKGMHQD